MTSTNGHRSQQSWWRGHHPLVWWITGVAAIFSLAYTILVPVYRAPDEQKHVDMIVRYDWSTGFPDPRERVVFDPGVWASGSLAGPGLDPALGYRPPLLAEQAQPRALRPTFAELATTQDPEGVPRRNQLTQHPPFHYLLVSSLGSLVGAAVTEEVWSWDREVWLYRALSVLLVAPLPLLAATASRALGIGSWGTVMAAGSLFLIPMLSFVGAVVSNDTSMILGSAVAVTACVIHLRDPTWKSAVFAAGGAAMAAWSKSTGATLLPWVFLVVLVAAIMLWRGGSCLDPLVNLGLTSILLLIGGGWHLSNLLRFGDPQPSSFTRRVNDAADTPLWPFLRTWFDRVAGTFWGEPARRAGVALPDWVVIMLTVVVVMATIALMIVVIRRRRHRVVTLLLGLLWLAQVGLLFRTNLAHYGRTGGFVTMQGRYLYSALVPLALLLALFLDEVVPKRSRLWIVVGTIATGAALHLILAGSMVAGFWNGEGLRGTLASVLAWSPLPPAASVVVLLLPLVATGGLAAAVFRSLKEQDQTTERAVPHRAAAPGTVSTFFIQLSVFAVATLSAGALVAATSV